VSGSFLYIGTRTPFGRYNGALALVRPDDLAADTVAARSSKTPSLDPGDIDEVICGDANAAGEDNRNVARMAVLLAGLPVSVPATTVNRLCGSSLDAAATAARAVEIGDAEITVAAGVESMTRPEWVLPKPSRAYLTAVLTMPGLILVNPKMPEEWTVSLGECNEQLQEMLGTSRQRQDAFAVRTPTPAALAPQQFGFAPVAAAEVALARAGIQWSDVAAVELNEAFAVQALACIDAWKVDPDIVNSRGGAIAIGHPLGASWARLVATLAKTLTEERQRWGVAAICIGVGQAIAMVLENCSGGSR
jgi:acetyl-CoA acetyltransferase